MPPLSLYVHLPWCLQKCPYCDFNSHALDRLPGGRIPEFAYVEALLEDLRGQWARWGAKRELLSIFIGGGTPSLFSGAAIRALLDGVRATCPLSLDCEITLEANPGAVEAGRFADYRAAGVNRLSIGVQSLSARQLRALGRVHGSEEARAAVAIARAAGFERLNLDLMFGLPKQDLAQALDDLADLIALAPSHISWYQLTLEPNTAYAANPPPVPGDDDLAEMQAQGEARLAEAGFHRYEVSAYAGTDGPCRHNLNYWRFGDYLGIGAGAHAKLTTAPGQIWRFSRPRHPRDYLAQPSEIDRLNPLSPRDLILEFMLNALRLRDGVPLELFSQQTGFEATVIAPVLEQARADGLLQPGPDWLQATDLGFDFLNALIARFDLDDSEFEISR